MSANDAYPSEVNFRRFHDIDDPEFVAPVEEMRATYRRAAERRVDLRGTMAIFGWSQRNLADADLDQQDGPSASKRVAVMAKLAIATAGLGLLTAGVALAGVNLPLLPDPSSDGAREAVAISQGRSLDEKNAPGLGQLPEEASDTAVSAVSTIGANLMLLQDGEISGCEFGAMVSAAARHGSPDSSQCSDAGAEQELPEEASDTADRVLAVIGTSLSQLKSGGISGCEFAAMVSAAARNVDPDPSRCTQSEKEAPELDTQASKGMGSLPPAKNKARGNEAKASGQARGDEVSDGKASGGGNGNGPSGVGQARANEAQSQSQAKGEEASDGEAAAGGNGNGASEAGQGTANEAQSQGQGNGEEASDGKANPGGPPN